jgi:hypothetical protein
LAAVANGGSYRMVSRARILSPGQNGTTIDDDFVLATPDIVGGSVTQDSTADVRSTLDITVSGSLWPKTSTDPLTPYGNELFVERGVIYGDGSREWVSLGYFRINTPEQQDAPFGDIQVAGSDRMQGIIDARIPYPLTFAAGEAVTSVIESLVTDVYDWAVFDFDDSLTGKTLATAQTTTDDRHAFLSTLVTSYGCVMYFDYRGLLVVKPPPDPDNIVTTLATGEGGVLSTLSRTLSRDGIYNGVIASGEQLADTIPPVSAMVVDSDPASPTYWDGQFGHVPQFFSSSFLTTDAQCTSAALSILTQSTGLPYNLDFGQVPNPALEPLDPVGMRYPGRRERHVISQLVVPLDAKTLQTGQTRQLVKGNFQ